MRAGDTLDLIGTTEPGNSLQRMLGILDLFDGGALCWTAEDMHERLGYTRSTLYRYLKVLADAEFLTSLPDVGYTLGPRIIELDYQIRTRDPLIMASRPVMAELARELSGIALLCRRYRDKVLCVHQERGTDAIHSLYERGRARPLLRGATSRIILAYLPAPKVVRLYDEQPAEFVAAGLGRSLAEVRASLRAMRHRGWDTTTGQVTPGVTGVAVPIFDSREVILGSLSLTVAELRNDPDRIAAMAERLQAGATVIRRGIMRA